MKLLFAVCICFLASSTIAQTITGKDLQLLIGSWKGSLTYLDYNSGKPYTMPANIDVEQLQGGNQFVVVYTYPDEPKANSKDTFLISDNGKSFNGAPITKKQQLKKGGLIFTTELNGQDGNDNKKAILKHIYTIQKNIFINRKEVKFTNGKKWTLRNEYRFTKK
jgi:hypothetical protein